MLTALTGLYSLQLLVKLLPANSLPSINSTLAAKNRLTQRTEPPHCWMPGQTSTAKLAILSEASKLPSLKAILALPTASRAAI